MNTGAIWALDLIIGAGFVGAAVAAVIVVRMLRDFLGHVTSTLVDLQHQVADLKEEAVKLMESTRTSETHLNKLSQRLTRLTASTDLAMQALPSALSSSASTGLLTKIAGTAMSIMTGYRFFRTFVLRRKS